MFTRLTYYIIGASALLILGFTFYTLNKNVSKVNMLSSELANSALFNDYIESAETNIELKNARIVVNLNTKETFDFAEPIEQFGVLEYYNKQFKYFLRNKDFSILPFISSIHINVNKDHGHYSFVNTIRNKKSGTHSNSILYKENNRIYTSEMLKQQISIYRNNFYEGNKEIEILKYAESVYYTLTQNGKYYKPKSDSKIIVESVTEKFQITFEEYDHIYKKYTLGFADTF